ncbi:MAG: TIM barrel protein [Fimbriimonas sp.]|nr:TIM barrel protein [Fimbriimonas sp.]
MDNLIAVSSWSLHRTIGVSYPDSPTGAGGRVQHSESPLDLLDLPAALAAHGYSAMQLCHFHLPSRSPSYVAEFRVALRDAKVDLLTLLIDDGDVTDPEIGLASVKWTADWVRTAAELGAPRARVIAGKQPDSREAIELSFTRLMEIAETAGEVDVQLEIENWHALLAAPQTVHELLDRSQGALRLNADFGNWPKPYRYEALPKIFRRAETCHAKFEFLSPTELDWHDASRCLMIAKDASFSGPMVLVNGGIGESDWDAMDIQRTAIIEA